MKKEWNKKQSTLFLEVVVKSWWTILFFLVIFFVYDRGVHYRNLEVEKLTKKLEDLNSTKLAALQLKKELQQQIDSQRDPAWIELVLMRALGLVPEGEKKILFVEKESSLQ